MLTLLSYLVLDYYVEDFTLANLSERNLDQLTSMYRKSEKQLMNAKNFSALCSLN